ncbi:NlpC/P60 family protein [Vibrio sp.]|uniref:NlpC/P60 family protein n=1 Tax=Vibrio sp. TaxID=678 RepID=UPI003D0E7EF1
MRVFHPLTCIVAVIAITACSSSQNVTKNPPPAVAVKELAKQDNTARQLLEVYQQWQGTPYKLGGSSMAGVDCSAFVQNAFQQSFALMLPRTTERQANLGQQINYQQAQSGDLVFFKTSRKVRHVGIYLGGRQFMHASTSKGVIISRLDNPYWADKFWQFRRVTTFALD